MESAEELEEKGLKLSKPAEKELAVLTAAVDEILGLSLTAFTDNDLSAAALVEPLEQVIDELKEKLRTHHILRMQQGQCGMEAGFVWSDLLTDLERVSDHCSNIAGCVTDMSEGNLNLHESLRAVKNDQGKFADCIAQYRDKYAVAAE